MPQGLNLPDEPFSWSRKTEKKKPTSGEPSPQTRKEWEELREKIKKELDPPAEKRD